MSFHTYILYSERLDLFYIGHTSDLESRVDYHNQGYETYTSKGIPWKLMWATTKETRGEAMQLELKLKNLNRKRLISLMLKYQDELIIDKEYLERFEP